MLVVDQQLIVVLDIQLLTLCERCSPVIVLFMFQTLVRVRDPPYCAICEIVMKQLESILEDEATEVKYVLLELF